MKILIALPVYNEAAILEKKVKEVLAFCQNNFLIDEITIVIADNGSTDQTQAIGQKLAGDSTAIKYLRIAGRGKGLAIKTAWENFGAEVYVFMDIDLATDLGALPALVAAIKTGSDVAIGNRFHSQSKVRRSFLRQALSWIYSWLARVVLKIKISDTTCGFKAIGPRVKAEILPLIRNQKFFFDSEMVILALRKGYKIEEIPVEWEEKRDERRKSKVKILGTVWEYLKNVWRMR